MKRFDERFTALDGNQLRHCLREAHLDGAWPEQYSKATLPFSLFDSDLVFGRGGARGKSTLSITAKYGCIALSATWLRGAGCSAASKRSSMSATASWPKPASIVGPNAKRPTPGRLPDRPF